MRYKVIKAKCRPHVRYVLRQKYNKTLLQLTIFIIIPSVGVALATATVVVVVTALGMSWDPR